MSKLKTMSKILEKMGVGSKELKKRLEKSSPEFLPDLSKLSKEEIDSLVDLGVISPRALKKQKMLDENKRRNQRALSTFKTVARNKKTKKFSKGGLAKKTKWESKWG